VHDLGVQLIDADPEIMRFLSEEERMVAGQVRLPIRTLPVSGPDTQAQLERDGAFGAIVLDGLVAHEIRLADRVSVRLLGPGDLIVWRYGPQPLILTGSRWLPASSLRLALFRTNMLTALERWPSLLAGMYLRVGQQLDRLAAQLMLSQLPRVEDRVLGVMWLMAESWGRVTAAGTRLSLDLTHELIGMMIGARRPTVSLALGELAARGAVIRQDEGWLLLEGPPSVSEIPSAPSGTQDLPVVSASLTVVAEPASLGGSASPASSRDPEPDSVGSYVAMQDALARLREEHLSRVESFDQRLRSLSNTRERCRRTRLALTRDRENRIRPVPS
jgi:CRP/FNR family transcriptional regulator, cyclic AMP receptor protein